MNAMNPQPRSPANTVLVLTEPSDTTADLVIKELDHRGDQIFRIDAAEFPLSLQVGAQFDGCWRGEIRSADGSVDLREIRSVYVRRPTEFVFPASMTDAEQRFAAREARRGIGGLLMSLPCSWVNHPSRVADAEYKPFQLAIATACGLAVPRTVVTNVSGDAGEHCAFLGSSVVYKTLASASVSDGPRPSIIYTTDVSSADMADSRVALTARSCWPGCSRGSMRSTPTWPRWTPRSRRWCALSRRRSPGWMRSPVSARSPPRWSWPRSGWT